MGRKPARQGQHFYFCVALLIFLSGCSLWQESSRRREIRDSLAAADMLFARGDFDGSLKAYQKILETAHDRPPADRAAYSIGLIYAHPQNPTRDLQKAIKSLDRIVRLYPDSQWAEQAKIWLGVLTETEESKREIEQVKRELETSKEDIEKKRLAIEKSRQEVEKSRLELEKIKQEIEKTKQLMEKSKQVDIEIDQKRRERGR
jgi:tetratricopeptide (TPR) repeat protein